LREARDNHVPLSVLFASTPTFYRQVGYEPAGASMFFRAPTHCLPTSTEGAEFAPLTPAEQAPIRDLYRAFASQRSGMLDRNEHFWRMQLEPYDGSRRYAYGIAFAGALEGYVCFQHARPNSTLIVQEALGTTPRAARAALALISHHKSLAESVVFPDGPKAPCTSSSRAIKLAPSQAASSGCYASSTSRRRSSSADTRRSTSSWSSTSVTKPYRKTQAATCWSSRPAKPGSRAAAPGASSSTCAR
jgi:hypothetical protein